MKKLTKILAMVLALATTAALSVGLTTAYLTDEDEAVNVMTLGNVQIEQLEYERVVENGAWVTTGETDKYGYTPDKIQEFTQAKPLYPAVFADGEIKWDDRSNGSHQQSWGQIDAPGSQQLFDDSVKNAQDKFVFVKNTGKSDAYVRTFVALEQGAIAAENFKSVIMTNTNAKHWKWENVADGVEIDGNTYLVLCATYLGASSNPTGILAPGAVSYASLLQVYMRPEATNADVEAIDGNNNGTYDILVLSQAVQTAGFKDAATALETAFPKGADNVNVPMWFNGVEIPEIVVDAIGMNKTTNQNGNFVLVDNIETSGDATKASDTRYGYGYEYIVRKGVDYTLNLNGKTVSHKAVNKNANNTALTYLFVANNAGTKLTIEGEGKVYCNNSGGYTCAIQGKGGTLVTVNGGDYQVDNGIAVWAGAGAHIVINGGSFVNDNATTDHELIYSSGGVIDIYGGFFHNKDGNYTLNVEDRNRATGFINVYGGTYVNFDPSTGGQDPNNIKVAAGYKVVSETQANGDIWYTVVPQ